MRTYEVPMQENGRIILPAELRRTLGLGKGDRVLIETTGQTVTLSTPALRRARARALVARHISPEDGVVDAFLAEKREAALREIEELDDRAPRTGGGPAGGASRS